MSSIVTNTSKSMQDHFEPEAALTPSEARSLRGYLEQIDYTAFAANQKTMREAMGQTSLSQFEALATAAARARGRWVAAAISMAETAQPSPEQAAELAMLRQCYDELSAAYEGLRRMVARGYLRYQPKS